MSTFLSEEWLAEARDALSELPAVDGADGVVQYVVSGAPDGKVQAHVEFGSGRMVAADLGKHPEPSCTVTLTYDDAVALFSGELTPEVAFMAGRAKVEGDHRVWLLDLRPVRQGEATATAMEELRRSTSV